MASSVGGQEAVAQLLETTVLDGFSTGWQLCVDDGSTQWTTFGGSDFMGTPIDGATVFNTYCALKPLLPTLLATMVQEGAFSWDGTVGEHLDAATHLKGVTFRSLLQHRSGVRRPSAVETAGLRADQRVDRALNAALISPPLEHFETLYTESAAWIVLGLAALASGVARFRILPKFGSWSRSRQPQPSISTKAQVDGKASTARRKTGLDGPS